jgi:hypothetical protein
MMRTAIYARVRPRAKHELRGSMSSWRDSGRTPNRKASDSKKKCMSACEGAKTR